MASRIMERVESRPGGGSPAGPPPSFAGPAGGRRPDGAGRPGRRAPDPEHRPHRPAAAVVRERAGPGQAEGEVRGHRLRRRGRLRRRPGGAAALRRGDGPEDRGPARHPLRRIQARGPVLPGARPLLHVARGSGRGRAADPGAREVRAPPEEPDVREVRHRGGPLARLQRPREEIRRPVLAPPVGRRQRLLPRRQARDGRPAGQARGQLDRPRLLAQGGGRGRGAAGQAGPAAATGPTSRSS